jgi:hypothetical protein
MIIIKLALLTCGFYLATALLLQGLLFVLALMKGGIGLHATRGGWFFFFAIVWFISFSLAWHIVSKGLPFKM